MDFKNGVTLGTNMTFEPPLFNGGGCCKSLEDVRMMAKSLAGAILVGSYTIEERSGNPGEVWWVGDGVALNSLGLPNPGMQYLKRSLREMTEIAHVAGKLLVVSVAGFSPAEYGRLTSVALDKGADAIEINLGCPNIVQNDGSRKPIPSYDNEVFLDILKCVETYAAGYPIPIWVKVSPNPITEIIKRQAKILSAFDFVTAVTAVNTFPNCYAVDDSGKSRISVGLAGMSGAALKHIGLGQVMQWRQALPEHIQVIASGGISSGQDIKDYQTVGAVGFQMTTELLKTGNLNAYAFERVAMEFVDL